MSLLSKRLRIHSKPQQTNENFPDWVTRGERFKFSLANSISEELNKIKPNTTKHQFKYDNKS